MHSNKKAVAGSGKKTKPANSTPLDRKAVERSKRRQAINKAMAGKSYNADKDAFTD